MSDSSNDPKPSITDRLRQIAEGVGPRLMGITGHTAVDMRVDETAVWEAAKREFERTHRFQQQKLSQTISFDRGPVCLVFVADLHCGGLGVDYPRIERDFTRIVQTPGVYVFLVGDLVDNFIIGKLMNVRTGTKFTVTEEWALAKKALELVTPRLLGSVGGNHDAWTRKSAGIDYLSDLHARNTPQALYDTDALRVNVEIEGQEPVRIKLRHKWRGTSIYNPTHAIERAAKFDKGDHFDIGVGAHTHVSGLVRMFNNGAETGVAVQCGAYKRHDKYADEVGYEQPNHMTAVPVVIHGRHQYTTFTDFDSAMDYMDLYWRTHD